MPSRAFAANVSVLRAPLATAYCGEGSYPTKDDSEPVIMIALSLPGPFAGFSLEFVMGVEVDEAR